MSINHFSTEIYTQHLKLLIWLGKSEQLFLFFFAKKSNSLNADREEDPHYTVTQTEISTFIACATWKRGNKRLQFYILVDRLQNKDLTESYFFYRNVYMFMKQRKYFHIGGDNKTKMHKNTQNTTSVLKLKTTKQDFACKERLLCIPFIVHEFHASFSNLFEGKSVYRNTFYMNRFI